MIYIERRNYCLQWKLRSLSENAGRLVIFQTVGKHDVILCLQCINLRCINVFGLTKYLLFFSRLINERISQAGKDISPPSERRRTYADPFWQNDVRALKIFQIPARLLLGSRRYSAIAVSSKGKREALGHNSWNFFRFAPFALLHLFGLQIGQRNPRHLLAKCEIDSDIIGELQASHGQSFPVQLRVLCQRVVVGSVGSAEILNLGCKWGIELNLDFELLLNLRTFTVPWAFELTTCLIPKMQPFSDKCI